MEILLDDEHPFIINAPLVDNLLIPLKRFEILHFTYIANYLDGSQVYLSNNSKWVKEYYRFALFNSSAFELNPSDYHNGYLIWPSNNTPVLEHGRKYYNSDNGITIIQRQQNHTEFFLFSSIVSNKSIINFYINHLSLLNDFINYFKIKASDLLNHSNQQRIYIPNHYLPHQKPTESDLLGIYNQYSLECIQELNIANTRTPIADRLIKTLGNIKLSKRQLECLVQVIEGKSAKEIAISLNLSTRTVETYLEILKNKFNCRTKLALISKFLTSPLLP